MKQSAFGKVGTALLALVIAFSVVAPALTPVSAAPTVPSTNNYPFVYDTSLSNPRDPKQVLFYSRTAQNLPDGSWYPNLGFDADWFGMNFAGYDLGFGGVPYGTVSLNAYSNYDLFWGGRGWSNAFIHQGRPPYVGGVYEGHFKAGSSAGVAIPVDGIRYDMNTQEPTGKYYLYITATLNVDSLYKWQSSNGLLVALLFQYEFQDGSLSLYDSPANTNNYQSLHFDIFLHRSGKIANIPYYWSSGSWSNTLGDAYNGDRHVQYIYNGRMNIGQTYTFAIDLGDTINHLKSYFPPVNAMDGLPTARAIILRYIQVSAETCGGHIGATIDNVEFIVN